MRKIVLLSSILPLGLLFGATENWITNADGDWGVAGNWSPATVPNAADEVANIGTAVLTASRVISLTTVAPTVGTINLVSLNAFGYTVSSPGTNSVTFKVTSGNASLTSPVTNTAAHTISAPIVLTSDLHITQDSAAMVTISGIMSGGGTVTVNGTSTIIFSGQNTFTGGLTVMSGTLQCNQATTLPATVTVTMSGGTLDLNNNAQTIRGLAGSAPISLGTAILTVNTTAANSYGGVISGAGGLSVGGTGSLTLTAANGYSGATTVTGGTLQLGINNALPAGAPVIMTGGTLNLNNFNQSVGSLSGTGGSITLGSGQLSIALGAGQNFSGVISGSGPVSFDGNGFIWTLGAAQTYTGLTTIDDGTIRLGVANGLPSSGAITMTATGILDLNNFAQTVGTFTAAAGAQVILGSGQLTVAPTANANFAGVISGSGGVRYQGPSTWVIQAAQTYTGGTTINGGILQMGVANGLASTGAVVVNSPGVLFLDGNVLAIASIAGDGNIQLGSGTLTLNTTASTTYSGVISGSGDLVVQGSGTQILTGTNTYSGGTLVGGTATLEGSTISLQGAIVNNSTLFFNQSFDGVFAGPLSGTGVLQVGGGGTLTLTGTPSQGSVSVLSGELDIAAASTLTATTVTVNSGAIIGGDGTITANILNAGSVNPGSIITAGTLTVNGNVTFQPGSSYITNLTPTTSDHLVVNGVVTINPGSQIMIDAIKGDYEEETRYAIITSTMPVVGTFDAVLQTNPFLSTTILYNQLLPGSVEVDLQIKSLSDVIRGGNAGAIAKCINQAHMRGDEDLEQLISEIIFFSVDEVERILNEMQPSQLRALTVAEQMNALLAQQMLNWRMAQFDRSTCEKEINRCFPWNFWVSLAGNWAKLRPAEHNVGYTAPAVGFTAGFDGRVAENLYFGVATEYGHTFLDWDEKRGSSAINRVSAGPYLSYIGRFGYVNTSILGSFAQFSTDRNIPFFDRTATSSHHGESLLPHLDAGLVFNPASHVTLTPFAMVDVLFGWEDGYKEMGAESLNFTIASSTSTMFRSELGLRVSKCAVRSHTKWVHDMKASWVREERLTGKELTASFRQFPCSFKVMGLFPSHNLLDLGMGLTFIFKNDRLAATLRYEGQFGTGITNQTGIARLLTRF